MSGIWLTGTVILIFAAPSAAKRLEGKPFALVGVNSDTDKEKLKKRMAEEKITWRSFWNGPKGTDGPISRTWNVRGWPTIYVLDHQGVIRFKGIRDKEMGKAFDQLLRNLAE
jgi:hypothetical protein